MSDARAEILSRIRTALSDVPDPERAVDVPVERGYRRETDLSPVDRFEERLHDYSASVRRVEADGVAGAVLEGCREMAVRRAAVPRDLPLHWRPDEIQLLEDHDLSARELDELDGAITGCAAAIAETGTLILDGQGVSGRRAITLIPDHHICIVEAHQIAGLVPEAIARVSGSVSDQRLPITLVSGPSATSDIELSRVEGVHGPRHLLVLIADG
jgi:L-lactate dehydrogenase complex protein LldG